MTKWHKHFLEESDKRGGLDCDVMTVTDRKNLWQQETREELV